MGCTNVSSLALQENHDKLAGLFSGPGSGQKLVWQQDLVSGAEFIPECLDKICAPVAGPSHDGQAPDQPNLAVKDVI